MRHLAGPVDSSGPNLRVPQFEAAKERKSGHWEHNHLAPIHAKNKWPGMALPPSYSCRHAIRGWPSVHSIAQ